MSEFGIKKHSLSDELIAEIEVTSAGTQYEVPHKSNIEVEYFTYDIDNVGTVTGTKTGGRLYPFFRLPGARALNFFATNSSAFVILGGDATSVIALGIVGGAIGLLYRFTNTDVLTLLKPISVGDINNKTCKVTYNSGVYEFFSDDVLTGTVNFSDISEYAESATPILGLVIYNPFIAIPNLSAIVNDRLTYIENKINTILPNPYKEAPYTSLGDSIEADGRTQQLLTATLRLGGFQNLAVSGATLLNNGTSSGCFKYLEVNPDARLITCNLGTNDFGISLPLGALGDHCNGTFYGALKIVTEGLVANHPLARIFWYTIQQRDYLGGGQPAGMTNNNGNTVEEFNNAIKIMCRKASIPVIDLYQDWGVSAQNLDSFTYDRLHPNAAGHFRRAKVILEKIKQYGL